MRSGRAVKPAQSDEKVVKFISRDYRQTADTLRLIDLSFRDVSGRKSSLKQRGMCWEGSFDLTKNGKVFYTKGCIHSVMNTTTTAQHIATVTAQLIIA